MAWKEELQPPIVVQPGETVSLTYGDGQHAALDALSKGYVQTLDMSTVNYSPDESHAVLPAGTVVDAESPRTWSGTVAEDVEPGEYFLSPGYSSRGVFEWRTITISIPVPVVTIPRPEEPAWDNSDFSVTLAELDGITWTLNGEVIEPGTHVVGSEASAIVTAELMPNFTFGDDDEPSVWQHTFPADGSAPDGITDGGKLVARWLGWTENEDIETASFHYWAVSAFVQAYTRDRGFIDGEPKRDVQVVIVSAAARLAGNPENLTRLQVDNVTESRKVFEGFNLAELGVLNRYRRRWA